MKRLEHLSVLKISGDDAKEFLQGQMTQSTDELNDDQIHLTSFCNPQGRVIATALIQFWNEAYYLILGSDLLDDLTICLSRYILRSKVILTKNEINIFGVFKKDTSKIDSRFNSDSLKSLSNDPERFILLSNKYQGEDTIDMNNWILEDIKSGIPLINKINSLEYIPQMLNLDHLEGISFTKGCYTGQEVVARVQHRGKIKQRMYQIEIEEFPEIYSNQEMIPDDFISPQVEVRNIDKKVGSVVISTLKDSFGYGLAVINISDADKDLSINGYKVNLNELV